jgi:hypothetical protein
MVVLLFFKPGLHVPYHPKRGEIVKRDTPYTIAVVLLVALVWVGFGTATFLQGI